MYPHSLMWIHNYDSSHRNGSHHTLTVQQRTHPEHGTHGLPESDRSEPQEKRPLAQTFTFDVAHLEDVPAQF